MTFRPLGFADIDFEFFDEPEPEFDPENLLRILSLRFRDGARFAVTWNIRRPGVVWIEFPPW